MEFGGETFNTLLSCLKLMSEIIFYQLHNRGSRERKMEYICALRYHKKSVFLFYLISFVMC